MGEMGGGCACGRIRYTAEVDSDEAYLCHCRMCQLATGSVSIAFKNVRKDSVRWEREPDRYQSSPIALRGYCKACGASLTFEYPDSEKIDLTVASFDNPGHFLPKHHFGAESMHRAWLNTEGLPEYRSDQHQPLVDRWTKAVGKLPD
jgi:hypothetical protein